MQGYAPPPRHPHHVGPFRAPAVAPPPAPMSVFVCRRCGIVAPTAGTACELCRSPLADVRVQIAPQSEDTFWVAVRCGFNCNSCRFLAPLDSLDADGAVECAQCGLRQRFDVSAWSTALEQIHAVGDLAGPDPEGRSPDPGVWIGSDNPHAKIGVTQTFGHLPAIGDNGLTVQACPGHPVCRRCQVPLSVVVPQPGVLHTSCSRCHERAVFTTPDGARTLSEAMIGVVADEVRSDRPCARATTEAGAVALRCPACGAPLTLSGTDRTQTCGFCKASCLVPSRTFTRVNHTTPEPDTWWILFRGASAKRRELLAPIAPVNKDLKAALNFIKPGSGPAAIGDEPDVYEAPVAKGVPWAQAAFTVLLGTIALAFGWLVMGR